MDEERLAGSVIIEWIYGGALRAREKVEFIYSRCAGDLFENKIL